tara:strand:+ start:78 stop:350 length:273 start_codon:yes stop_codon:yes gene_type:complete
MNIISRVSEGERNTSNYTKWILITKKFKIVGRLEHSDFETRDKARSWFLVTTLLYDLPENRLFNITIYNMLGNEINRLVNEVQNSCYKST